MATKKPTQPRAANGKFAKKQPRPISSLKPTEAIQVNNDAERDGILKLMEAEGWNWASGKSATSNFEHVEYPYCLDYGFGGGDNLCICWSSVSYYKDHHGATILPASDFLPTEFSVANGFKSMADKIDKQVADKLEYPTESSPTPTDHPLHPEFKRAKVRAKGKQNPTQPIDYKSLFHQAQSKVDELQAKVEDLNSSYEFERVQRNVHREIIREKIINYAKNHPSSHSAQLLGELILDGLI